MTSLRHHHLESDAFQVKGRRPAHPTFNLCLSCVLVLLVGCSEKRPPERVDSSASSPTINSDSFTQEHLGDGGTTETVDLWSDAIKAQLAHLAHALAAADASEAGAAPSLADRIEMIDTDVMEAKELYHGLPVRVTALSARDVPGAVIQVKSDDFVRRIRDLLHLTADAQEPAAYFKLYGIERHGEHLKTRQRLTTQGKRAGKRVGSYAVVDATWLTTKDAPPRLVSFSMPKSFQVELISGEIPLFDDIGSSVLGDNPAWPEQLQLGMNTWARRIERSLKPDFLGYHGLAVADVDGDDLEDLYLCQPGGLPNLLFRQQADGKLVDISAAAGVDWLDNSTGALLVDLDNDGDADLAVATQREFVVMENDGTGRFSLRARLSNVGLGYSPTAADYDLDGDLDILVLRYVADERQIGDFPAPHPFHDARNGGANVLLENQGNFRFVDVTDARGMGVDNCRFSFAASWEDYDNDGDVDVYVANDFGPNTLLRNDAGKFVDVSVESGTQNWNFGMSATWADYDRDGHMDIYVSSMFSGAGNQVIPQADFNLSMPEETRQKYLKMVRGNSLLRNVGQGRFADVTNPMVEGYGRWAWGSKFADLNNDGWEDIYVANGYISQPDKDDL